MARATSYVTVQTYGPYDPGDVISGAEFSDDEIAALVKDNIFRPLADGDKPKAVVREAQKAAAAEEKRAD